jgi:hypothetical protein
VRLESHQNACSCLLRIQPEIFRDNEKKKPKIHVLPCALPKLQGAAEMFLFQSREASPICGFGVRNSTKTIDGNAGSFIIHGIHDFEADGEAPLYAYKSPVLSSRVFFSSVPCSGNPKIIPSISHVLVPRLGLHQIFKMTKRDHYGLCRTQER